ncbi:sulfur carrier protein ThiS [Yanghanlia caeni]|uniref:Sulfur carrier protein ThiS n=1 Tax=Yanghanlia caeni TaxID=3064283 RepID=A0ABU1D4Q8_9BURK|nr:sulfur carrier protein ThiS [Alcaligenaceae bacterium LG-2]NGR07795.1 sulfur carrier protein ThiS [bacterium SGD-2]HZH57330.1 sulfur carrier protein ThiS [Burkholderiaceae bacterium]
MNIILNGEERRVDAGQTVLQLIEQLGYQGKRIAVERNGEIVPRSAHASTPLAEGDRLEIVIAVGGG